MMDRIHRAIDLSRCIQKAIGQSDWQEVEKLDRERLKLIDEYYRTTEAEHMDAEQTRILKDLNDEIVQQLTEIRQQTQDSQLALKHAKKATHAYLDTATK
jgi:isocitrate dehydrogenase kinase/phosphatase